MNLKKRIGALVLSLVLAISLLPVNVLAGSDMGSLEPGVTSLSGGEYKLTDNYVVNGSGITISGNVTIDLYGHFLTIDALWNWDGRNTSGGDPVLFHVNDGATLTLKNTGGNQPYTYSVKNKTSDYGYEGRVYTVETRGGTVLTTSFDRYCTDPLIEVDGNGKVVAEGVRFQDGSYQVDYNNYYKESEWQNSGVHQLFDLYSETAALEMTGCEVTGFSCHFGESKEVRVGNAITNYGTVTLTDCTFNACGYVSSTDYVDVDDDDKGAYVPAIYNAGKMTVSGGRFYGAPIYNAGTPKLDKVKTTGVLTLKDSDSRATWLYTLAAADVWDTINMAPCVYNEGTVNVSGGTRVGDLLCEYTGGIAMENGSVLNVVGALDARSGSYSRIPSVIVSPVVRSEEPRQNDKQGLRFGFYMDDTCSATITGDITNVGLSLLGRINGKELAEVDEGNYGFRNIRYKTADAISKMNPEEQAGYTPYTPLDIKLADVVLNEDSLSGAIDLTVSGLDGEELAYYQQYIELLEQIFDSEFDLTAVAESIDDAYLRGFFTTLNELVFAALEDGDKGLTKEFNLVIDTAYPVDDGEQRTIGGLAKRVVAAALNYAELTEVIHGNENASEFAMFPFDSVRGMATGVKYDESTETWELQFEEGFQPENPNDRSIVAWYGKDNDKGMFRYAMGAEYGNTQLNKDGLFDSYIMTALLASGAGFNRKVEHEYLPTGSSTKVQAVKEFNNRLAKTYENTYEFAIEHDELTPEAAAAKAKKDVAEYLEVLSCGGYNWDSDSGKLKRTSVEWSSGLTEEEFEPVVAIVNDSATVWGETLPEGIKFNDKYVAPVEVQEYYKEKLDTLNEDGEALFELVYGVLTGGVLVSLDNNIAGNTNFSLLNDILALAVSAENGTLDFELDVDETLKDLIGLPKALFNEISGSRYEPTLKKYAKALYLDENKMEYPEDFDDALDMLLDNVLKPDKETGETMLDAMAEEMIGELDLDRMKTQYGYTDFTGEGKFTVTDLLCNWLTNPAKANITEVAFDILDRDMFPADNEEGRGTALEFLEGMMGVSFVRVGYTPATEEIAPVSEEDGFEKIDSFAKLKNTYGRYELGMMSEKDKAKSDLISDAVSKMLRDGEMPLALGYSLRSAYVGHINVMPSDGSAPIVDLVMDEDGKIKMEDGYCYATIVGDPALGHDYSNATVSYWLRGNKSVGGKLTGADTLGKEVKLAQGEEERIYAVQYSIGNYTSAIADIVVPGKTQAKLEVKDVAENTTLTISKGEKTYGSDPGANADIPKDLGIGLYNLELRDTDGNVKTYLVEVTKDETTGNTVCKIDDDVTAQLENNYDKKTQVIVNEPETKKDASISQVVVGGLNKVNIANCYTLTNDTVATELKNSSDTKLVLEVTNKAEPETKPALNGITEMYKELGNNNVSYIDLSVYLRDKTDENKKAQVEQTDSLLTIYVPFDTSSRSNLHVIRYHGDKAEEILEKSADQDLSKEYFEVVGAYVVMHVQKFSDYAISYTDANASVGGGGAVKETATTYDKCKKGELCPIANFTDAKTDVWYHDGVHYCIDNGLMNGVSATSFAPAGTTTREMVWTILARLDGQTIAGASWAEDARAWAMAKGVSDGTNGKNAITREQLAAMLFRFAKMKGCDVSVGEDTNILSYNDAFSVTEYAVSAMQWACGSGVVNGDNNNLKPTADATRAEVATMFMRYCENVIK